MRDYRHFDENHPNGIAVADMPTEMIHDHLQNGVVVINNNENTTVQDVIERLNLELYIRENNLRSEFVK